MQSVALFLVYVTIAREFLKGSHQGLCLGGRKGITYGPTADLSSVNWLDVWGWIDMDNAFSMLIHSPLTSIYKSVHCVISTFCVVCNYKISHKLHMCYSEMS